MPPTAFSRVGEHARRLIRQPDPSEHSPLLRRIGSTLRHGGVHSQWIVFCSLITTAGTIVTPLLLHRPVLLLLLAPRTVAVALAAGHLDLAEFLVLGTLRLSLADPSYFVMGRRFASIPGARRGPRGPLGRLVLWLLDLIGRSSVLAGVVLFLRPSGRYLAVAGAKGVSVTLAMTAAATGTICYLAVVHTGRAQLF